MHLSEIFIENFRVFGSEEDGTHLHLRLHSGLNVIAGENDSGKTAIMDAIRLMLWTTSYEYVRLTEEDFHVAGGVRAEMMRISGTFSSLSSREQARFLEWLSADDSGKPCLVVTMQATRLEPQSGRGRAAKRVGVTFRAGGKGEGPPIEGEIREFLRITYLRPLRDAEAEMAAGRGSRLSQILENHPDFAGQADSDFDPSRPVAQPKTLVGIMRQAEHLIAENAVVTSTKKDLNEGYLDQLSITGDPLRGDIGVARSTELRQILEKLELWLEPPESAGLRIPRGLGFNNVLFMGTELLLLAVSGELCKGGVSAVDHVV